MGNLIYNPVQISWVQQSRFVFPRSPNVSLDKVKGNIEILWKVLLYCYMPLDKVLHRVITPDPPKNNVMYMLYNYEDMQSCQKGL